MKQLGYFAMRSRRVREVGRRHLLPAFEAGRPGFRAILPFCCIHSRRYRLLGTYESVCGVNRYVSAIGLTVYIRLVCASSPSRIWWCLLAEVEFLLVLRASRLVVFPVPRGDGEFGLPSHFRTHPPAPAGATCRFNRLI